MKTIKSIFNYIDLYSNDLLMIAIKKEFKYFSHTTGFKSIPKQGSNCFKSEKVNIKEDVKFKKLIEHENGSISLQTNEGYYLTFLNL